MLRYVIFLLLCGLSVNLWSQRPKAHYYVRYNAGLGYRIIVGDELWVNALNELESPTLVHGGEVLVDLPIGRKFGIITGLGFQTYGVQVKREIAIIDPSFGFVYEADFSGDIAFWRYYSNFLTLPIHLRWTMHGSRKSSWDLRAGITNNIYLYGKQRNVYKYKDGSTERSRLNKEDVTSAINIAGSLGVTYTFKVGKKIRISLGPQFDAFLNTINEGNSAEEYPYKISWYLGVGI